MPLYSNVFIACPPSVLHFLQDLESTLTEVGVRLRMRTELNPTSRWDPDHSFLTHPGENGASHPPSSSHFSPGAETELSLSPQTASLPTAAVLAY